MAAHEPLGEPTISARFGIQKLFPGCIIEDVEFVGGDLAASQGGGGLAAVSNDDVCSLECEKRPGCK